MADANLCKDGTLTKVLFYVLNAYDIFQNILQTRSHSVSSPRHLSTMTTTQNNLHPSSYSSYVYVVVAAPGLFHNNMAWPKRQTYLHDNRPRYATTVSIVLFLDEVNWEKHTVTGVSHCVCGTNKVPLQFHSIP